MWQIMVYFGLAMAGLAIISVTLIAKDNSGAGMVSRGIVIVPAIGYIVLCGKHLGWW